MQHGLLCACRRTGSEGRESSAAQAALCLQICVCYLFSPHSTSTLTHLSLPLPFSSPSFLPSPSLSLPLSPFPHPSPYSPLSYSILFFSYTCTLQALQFLSVTTSWITRRSYTILCVTRARDKHVYVQMYIHSPQTINFQDIW